MYFDVDVDFNILTAFIRLGRAGPERGRVPSIISGIVPSIISGIVPSIISGIVPFLLLLFDFIDFIDFFNLKLALSLRIYYIIVMFCSENIYFNRIGHKIKGDRYGG